MMKTRPLVALFRLFGSVFKVVNFLLLTMTLFLIIHEGQDHGFSSVAIVAAAFVTFLYCWESIESGVVLQRDSMNKPNVHIFASVGRLVWVSLSVMLAHVVLNAPAEVLSASQEEGYAIIMTGLSIASLMFVTNFPPLVFHALMLNRSVRERYHAYAERGKEVST
jgi:hypothetical protein